MNNPNRLAVLRAIVELHDEHHGVAPSYREIAERAAMGWTSTAMVHHYVKALQQAGYVYLIPGGYRAITPTDAGRAFLQSAALREGAE